MHGASVSRASWCRELNLAHNKHFVRVACRTEVHRAEREEGYNILRRTPIGQSKVFVKGKSTHDECHARMLKARTQFNSSFPLKASVELDGPARQSVTLVGEKLSDGAIGLPRSSCG